MGLFGKDIHHFHSNTTSHMVPYEKTVIEKKAPTDESVRLYKEILEKSRSEILDEMRIQSCGFEVVGVLFCASPSFCYENSYWKFRTKINGEVIDFNIEFNSYESRELGGIKNPIYRAEVARMVFKKMSETIALKLIADSDFNKQLNEKF